MTDAQHHLHKRKRLHIRYEPMPHPVGWKRTLDKAIYAVGVLEPILVIPQAWKIWAEKNAAGVSVFAWSGFVILGVIWLIYSIVHREKPLIITYIGFIIIQSIVVIGAILYG